MMGEVIRVSGRTPDVGEFLREAMLSQRFADVALCCPGGQRFLAHRLVLSAASPYLQEVLLAHSKSTSHCEPITVILAEIEAPELAALLGFVYTGSATVPRPRLDAFLRAAENLRITLPPIPVLMTCTESDCKQEDAKDIKISPKYLQCDQYPTCDDWWCRGRNPNTRKAESYEYLRSTGCNETLEIPSKLHSESSLRSRIEYASTWQVPSIDLNQDRGVSRLGDCLEEDARRFHPASTIQRMDKSMDQVEKSSFINNVCDSSAKFCRQDLDPLELRLRADYTRLRTGYTMRRFISEEEIEERGFMRFQGEKSLREERVGSRETSFQARTTALPYNGRPRSRERSDYGNTGEDLTCADSCCRWRTPRRHVANRVTASPWKQIVRPHHMPKIQPIVLQTHVEDTETGESAHIQEIPRPVASSISPSHESPKNIRSSEKFYAYEVPKPSESYFNATPTPSEPTINPETRRQETAYYGATVPFATTPQADLTATNNIRGGETFFQVSNNNQNIATKAPASSSENIQAPSANNKSGYFGQVVHQTSTKPEISHPVSRLCDTIEIEEKKESYVGSEVKKHENEPITDDKVGARIFVNSDSNNNDAIVSSELSPRNRNTGPEDHKCDQCGKTFVTRASLKVHSRTHSGEKPFRCADCGKQFSQLRNYKYHRSVHEGTREFAATCPECGKYFNDRGYLSSHMKIHRNRKEYGCAECGKSFNQRVAYNMHVRIHTGVKPHQCEQCGKAFSRKMLLKQHLRTHSGERPYQCQVCQKAFADRSNMTLHTRLHSGLKPYQCTLCSKAFTKKHHLKTHLNYHTGTKPYSCPNCGLRFSQSSNMRTHFKKCSINNPGGLKTSVENSVEVSSNRVEVQGVVPRTPTDALTPPNSDQESSILTPISKTAPVEPSGT